MPVFDSANGHPVAEDEGQFPPVTRDHILNCSYEQWFPKYKSLCIKSRMIPLTPEFIEYLEEDGIILSGQDDDDDDDDWEPSNPSVRHPVPEPEDSDPEDDATPPSGRRLPPNKRFPDLHQKIQDEIQALGGSVAPKLNWSSPKDAAWITANTVECKSPDDVYLLLKSSNFISHDLTQAFDGCIPPAGAPPPGLGFSPVLVLRSFFPIRTSLEFRCFVKHRNLVAITPRDLKFYHFSAELRPAIIARAKELFVNKLKFAFPDGCFAFDVYIPEEVDMGGGLARARLIDINPWAPRTDTLLFTWNELLELHVPNPILGVIKDGDFEYEEDSEDDGEDSTDSDEEEDDDEFEPELRLVEKDDPAAYNFSSPEYSAHKMPKEVVDASQLGGAGLREFAEQWARAIGPGT